jgi:adiponectin receptor
MDYCGIVVLIVTSFAPWVHFGFYCDTSYLKTFYLTAATVCGLGAMFVVAADRFRGGEYRTLRAGIATNLDTTSIGLIIVLNGLQWFSSLWA